MRALLLTTCIALAGLVVLELAAPRGDSPSVQPTSPRARAKQEPIRAQQPNIEDLVAAVLSRPLFTPSRRPPDTAASPGSTDPDLRDVRLTGIVVEPDRRLAIFATPGAKPFAVSEGETLNGWRLDAILPQEVSLSGPSGTRTLQPKADTKLVRPGRLHAAAGQPQIAAPPASARTAAPPRPAAVQLPPASSPPNAPKPRPRRSAHDE